MRSAARWSSRSCASEIAAEHTSGRSKRHAGKQAAANHRRGKTADPDRASHHRRQADRRAVRQDTRRGLADRRQDDCRHTGLRDGRRRPRCRRRAARLRSAPLAGHELETAQAHPARLGRSRRRRSLAARRAREPRHGHADPARRRARDQLRDRQSAVVRRGGRQALRRACASRRQRHRNDLAHAARRGRRDTALECAGHDRRLETRPGPRCRKFGGAQAGRGRVAVCASPSSRSKPACRKAFRRW